MPYAFLLLKKERKRFYLPVEVERKCFVMKNMVLLILVSVLATIAILAYFWHKKHLEFVQQNSTALKKLQQINARYHFFTLLSCDEQHIYDNSFFYNSISCSDYLIYQLQYTKTKVKQEISKAMQNRKSFAKYQNEIKTNVFESNFAARNRFLSTKYLLQLEHKIIEEKTLLPQTQFSVPVVLGLSDLNGRLFERKRKTFYEKEILSYINRLENKTGYFFNDRQIWDAICRVERGKVSNKMRFSIYSRDGYRCKKCGRTGNGTNLEIDHIVPISKGGKSTYDNLQTLCHSCNVEKGNKIER